VRELERDLPETAGATAGTTRLPRVALVGRGRLGGAIARAGAGSSLDLATAGRDDALETCREAGAALLCVPDTAISGACETISAAVPPLRLVGHTSGATGLDALSPATARGAEAFSLHPLQTVPDGRTDLTGAPCAVSGTTDAAAGFAAELADALGMRPFEVPEERRAAYHAAASIASNFLVALEESAAGLLAGVGIDDARELLAPLVLRTAANWSERGGEALTGPIARGDEATVAAHLDAIRELAPELLPLYEALAERTRSLAEERR
jgi:predicted short-subunit dehydrogenase-like oxidoreductase (DUF2520 family)